MGAIKEGRSDLEEIFKKIKHRDFSGNSGTAIKSSAYQVSTGIAAKIGGLIFTVIIARQLMPELFGLYSLVLSTIIIFASFAELGINSTLVRFVSKEIGKKSKKIRPYIIYLLKIKIILISFSVLVLAISAKFVAYNFYSEPIFLALLAGILYIFFVQMLIFMQALLEASNYFKGIFQKEIIFQVSRLVMIPLAILLSLKYGLSTEMMLANIVLLTSFSVLIASLFLLPKLNDFYFKNSLNKSVPLSTKQKKEVNAFIISTAAFFLSGVFFTNVDKIILGRFVSSEFIGYYGAASSLIAALTPLVIFSSVVLLPIFSRLKGKRLEDGFKKSVRITFLLGCTLFVTTILFSHLAILLAYGKEYLQAVNVLRILSFLLLIFPLTGIYSSYFISLGKPRLITKLLVVSTIINIILNYLFITYFLQYGELFAIYGSGIAMLISQVFYLVGLVWYKKKMT